VGCGTKLNLWGRGGAHITEKNAHPQQTEITKELEKALPPTSQYKKGLTQGN